ncbi:ribonuclease H-like domain-containing protein [Phycomyces nitens]|nr:ribonuclease H-like domain-containing protein [Phycomyces nitens]
MEISRQQFIQRLPTIKKAIDECDFIAIDAEFSGLHRPGTSKRIDTLANRYAEYREATKRFIIIQFGMCTFKWDGPSGRYIAKPFNFYIFPTAMTGKVQANKTFMTQAQAFDFLSKQQFDFNKWIYQGVPYMTREEEKAYIKDATQRLNDAMPDIPLDEKERGFLEAAREEIDAWVANPKPDDPEGVNIIARNAYQRRLIYQETRNRYEGLVAEGKPGFIRIARLSKKDMNKRTQERQKQFEKDCEGATGFRRVIDWISESKKIVVGHNMLLDICHVIGQFVEPLPESVHDFKALAHTVFPNMVDTKHLSTFVPEFQPLFGSSTSLDILRFETNKAEFKNPRIDMDWEFPRYLTEKAHEAGYDAFMTGSVFLKMVSFLDKARNPKDETPEEEVEPVEEKPKEKEKYDDGWEKSDDEEQDPNWLNDTEEIYNHGSTKVDLMNDQGKPVAVLEDYINKANMVRTGFEYFNFVNPEVITRQSNTFYVSTNSGPISCDAVSELFESFGKNIVDVIDNMSAFVVYENLREKPAIVKESVMQKAAAKSGAVHDLTIKTVGEYLDSIQK